MWFGFESEVRGFIKQKYILVFKERKYSYRHFVKHNASHFWLIVSADAEFVQIAYNGDSRLIVC